MRREQITGERKVADASCDPELTRVKSPEPMADRSQTEARREAEPTHEAGRSGVNAGPGRPFARFKRFRGTRAGGLVIRILIAIIGTAVIAGGVVLLPLPGPGWLIIFTGLGILALEFDWAARLLHFGRMWVLRWDRWYRGQGLALRITLGLFLAAFLGALVLLTATYTFGWSSIVRWWQLLPGV